MVIKQPLRGFVITCLVATLLVIFFHIALRLPETFEDWTTSTCEEDGMRDTTREELEAGTGWYYTEEAFENLERACYDEKKQQFSITL